MTPQKQDKQTQDNSKADSEAKAQPEPLDDLVVTEHEIMVDGAPLRYTATAGRVVLRREQHTDDAFEGHKATAEVFIVAYTAALEGQIRRSGP